MQLPDTEKMSGNAMFCRNVVIGTGKNAFIAVYARESKNVPDQASSFAGAATITAFSLTASIAFLTFMSATIAS